MLSFFERSQYGGKDAFYGIKISYRVQKSSQFKVRKFRSVSYKKTRKIEIWDTLRKTHQLPQFKPDLDEIWTKDSVHVLEQFHVVILENYENF